jgi:DNA-binding MarR family transcriptional regulator
MDITGNRKKVLLAVSVEGAYPSKISEYLGKNKYMISAILKELKDNGLVSSEVDEDARFRKYKITKKGGEALKKGFV